MSELPPRYPLILNPKAKSEKGRRALKFIMENATRFTICATRSREEAIDLSRKFVRDGEELVIAAGGDGTLNAVVEGLAGSETALGVFPTGTMNVFAREMGIPYDKLENAMEVIDGGHSQEVDLFAMNGAPFVQMAGVGFDAQVIEETTWESKKRLGPFAYLFAATKVLCAKPPEFTVTCSDGREVEGVAMLVGNGSLYGGQFPLFKNASNSDSLLDVVVFKEAGYQFLKDSLRGFVKGGIDPHSHGDSVEYLQATALKVTSGEEVPVEVDGELWGRSSEIDFSPTGKTLKVFAPLESKVKFRYALLKILSPWRD
ncbi:diacylglycerol kinase family lipid kinase [Akkermansiaceae bacterium]|nr:diacylglycerol kinase family lipid kinase [Akkermansiaceae bacterium]MDF1713437.1 diacylglycerol kinase family lipid kinase [Akkermansiaceae bacterium]